MQKVLRRCQLLSECQPASELHNIHINYYNGSFIVTRRCRVAHLFFPWLWLSKKHHERVSTDAPSRSEACFCFELGARSARSQWEPVKTRSPTQLLASPALYHWPIPLSQSARNQNVKSDTGFDRSAQTETTTKDTGFIHNQSKKSANLSCISVSIQGLGIRLYLAVNKLFPQ